MNKRLFQFLGLIVVLTLTAFGQNTSSDKVAGPNATTRLSNLEADFSRFLESDDEVAASEPSRPRIVETKVSAVKAAVISKTASAERQAFDMVNEKRIETGLGPLAWNDEVAAVARLHSQNMAEFNFFGHRGLDNKMVSDRADDQGIKKWRSIGENIAYNRGYQDAITKAVELWLASPSHYHNMMDPNWKESAIGVAIAEDGSYYFTQVFLKK